MMSHGRIAEDLQVGDVVTVGRACMGSPAGARAVVVERYELVEKGTRRPGWTLLFENRSFDGFSPTDCEAFEVRKVGHEAALAGYRFTNAARLHQDWYAGVFANVWARTEANHG
jgi:hypothetical protein